MNSLDASSLKQNPFTTHRDPVTGQWQVILTPRGDRPLESSPKADQGGAIASSSMRLVPDGQLQR
jgi:hypothetical protein